MSEAIPKAFMKNWVLMIIWAAGAFYSALCVFLPEVRPSLSDNRFLTGEKKVGLLSCVGFAMALWLPALFYAGMVTGLISESHTFGIYVLFVLGIVVATIGGWVDLFS